jgi:hypothetical protein
MSQKGSFLFYKSINLWYFAKVSKELVICGKDQLSLFLLLCWQLVQL